MRGYVFILRLNCLPKIDRDLDERMRAALHSYLEERGVDEGLYPFLQTWLYVKDHRHLMNWFKSVGTFINDRNPST